jgi:hypothetical protein
VKDVEPILKLETEMTMHEEASPTTTTNELPAPVDAAQTDQSSVTNGGRAVSLAFAIILLGAIGYGIHSRSVSATRLSQATQEAAVLSVNVVHPTPGSQAGDLALPGNVQAFTDTPSHGRNWNASRPMRNWPTSRAPAGRLCLPSTPSRNRKLTRQKATLLPHRLR